MSTAQNVLNFKGPSLRAEFESKAQVVTKVDAIEDQGGIDQKTGARGNSKASKRAFLAQTATCTRPVEMSASTSQLQQLLNEAEAFIGEGKPTPSKMLAMLETMLPQLRDLLPQGTEKTVLSNFLNSQSSSKSADPKEKDSGDLYDYLTALVLFQITTAKAQTNIAKMNQTTADAAVKMSQAAEVQAEADIKKIDDEIAAQQKSSFWGNLLGCLGVALGVVVMLLTGSPMLLILAIVGIATSQITVDGKSLDQHLTDWVAGAALTIATAFNNGYTPSSGLVTFLKDVILGGIAILETVVMGGAEGLLESASEDAAKVATATVDGVEMVSMNVVKGAELVGENVAKDVGMVSQNFINDAADVLKTVLKSGGKAIGRLTDNGRRVGKLMMVLSSTGAFLPTVCQQIAEAAYPDDKNAQIYFAMALQLGAGLVGSFGGGYLSGTFQGPSLIDKLTSKFGESAVRYTKNSLKLVQMAANTGGAGFDVEAGFILRDEQATLRDQGDARFTMIVAQAMIDSLQTISSNATAAFKGVYAGLADMNQSVAERLDPWDPRNYAV